jgi:predicted DNA-binding transcriptional regulator YafY
VLVQAVSQHRRARLEYRSEAGSEWLMEVEPWAVVVRHGRWYLLCRVPAKDALRTYRLDRVRTVDLLGTTFTPPDDLDPVGLLEEHLAVGWEYAAEVVIEQPIEQVQRYLPRGLGRLEVVDEQTTRLVGSTGNPYWYAERLALIHAPFRVVGGVELQHATRALGERLLAAGTH